jgi:BirA family biotin operon repressor/biotin-[acetyl-CoA-carboxylase] ligase
VDREVTDRAARALPGGTIAGPLLGFRSVGSTQDLARALAAGGWPEGTVVVAEHQTAGRGRRGRAWIAPPGAGLLCSVLLRPALSPGRWPEIGLAAACAVADGVEAATGARARLKWPNDVLVDERKVAGVLAEGVVGPRPSVVVGIGVNLESAPGTWAPELAARAASLAQLGYPVAGEVVLAAVLRQLESYYRALQHEGFAPIGRAWRRRGLLGGPVRAAGVSGVAVDLAPDGALIVEQDDGVRIRLVAGEVETVAGPGREPVGTAG